MTNRGKIFLIITALSITSYGLKTVFGLNSSKWLSQFLPTRSIASIYQQDLPADHLLKTKKRIKEVLKINCDLLKNKTFSSTRSIASTSEVVMIQFENCSQKKFPHFKIQNINNGYQAEIFKNNKKIVATDFIQLGAGENIFDLEYSLNAEQKIKYQLKVQRH